LIEDFALLFHMIATKIAFGEIGTGFLGSLYAPSLTSESIVALDYIVNNTLLSAIVRLVVVKFPFDLHQ